MLSIIIVSWNTRHLLHRCLTTLQQEQHHLALEIIVVDNGSHDGTPQMIRDEFPQVRLIEPGANLGFSAGNNLGLREARGEWLMLLNPDTEVEAGALLTLVRFLEAHPTVGVVGPTLIYGDGSQQASRHRLPSLLTLFLASTPLASAFAPLLRSYYMENTPNDHPHPVDWLSGAALLLRREVYDVVGGLDEQFFMYFEETDWQRRIKAAGWPIWFVPDAVIHHHEDASSGQVVGLRHIRFNRSRLRYAAKWHGEGVAGLLRIWLSVLFGVEWLKEAGKWMVGHKRSLRRQRMEAYRQLLFSLKTE